MPLMRPPAQGFTLVEVLVTVFVVAIGLLAASALQAVSKKAAVDALQRTTASVVAQDMIERIRANSTMLTHYQRPAGNPLKATPTAPVCGGVVSGSVRACEPRELVDYDLHRWWQAIDGAGETIATTGGSENAGGLRDAMGCITATGNQVDVVVVWRGMSRISQEPVSGDADDPTSDACGATEAAYEPSGSQSFRRVLRIRAYVPT